jgi:hypothetical protein
MSKKPELNPMFAFTLGKYFSNLSANVADVYECVYCAFLNSFDSRLSIETAKQHARFLSELVILSLLIHRHLSDASLVNKVRKQVTGGNNE